MKTINQLVFTLSLALVSVSNAFATPEGPANPVFNTPEIDANIAVLGLGLLAGVMSLVSEYRRKK